MAVTQRIYKLVVDASQANHQLGKINSQLSQFGNSARAAGNAFKNAFAGAIAGLSFTAFINNTKQAIEELDKLAKTADNLGVSVTGLQELEFAAARSGVATSTLTSSMTAFLKRMGELRQQTGPLYAALKKYDEALIDTLANTESQEEALNIMAERMLAAESATERAFIANAAFNRSGIAMVNMLKNGKIGLDELRTAAREAGTVVEENLTRKAEVLNDRWDTLTKTISVRFVSGLVALADASSKLAGTYNNEADLVQRLNEIQTKLVEARNKEATGSNRARAARQRNIDNLEKEKAALEAQLKPMEERNKRIKEAQELAKQAALDSQNGGNGSTGGFAVLLGEQMQTAKDKIAAFNEKMKEQKDLLKDAQREAEAAAKSVKAEADSITQSVRTPFEVMEGQLSRLDELYSQGLISWETLIRAQSEALDKYDHSLEKTEETAAQTNDALMSFIDDINNGVTRWSQQSADAIVEFARTGESAFSDLAESIIADLARMAVQAQITKPLFDFFSDLLPGGSNANTASAGDPTFNALGNIYDQSGLVPFARGGVVTRPTVFPFANGIGLMAESGPEAIMPLKRNAAGELGVSGGNVVVNIQNNSGGQVSTQENRRADGTREINVLIESAMERAIANGRMDKVFGNAYGFKRRGA